MTTYQFKYKGKDRNVLVFEDTSDYIKGLDLNAMEPALRQELMDYMKAHQENMDRFTKVAFRNFSRSALESEVSRGRLLS